MYSIFLLPVLFPDSKGKRYEKLCLLDVDMFHYLVALVMSLPSLHLDTTSASSGVTLPSGGLNDQHALHLVMAVHLVQILLSFDHDTYGKSVYVCILV